MNKSFDQVRDEKLRAEILRVLFLVRGISPSGGLSGDRLMAEVSVGLSNDMGFTDESHFIGLCRDLVSLGMVEQKDKGTRRAIESLKPRHLAYSITFRGVQLVEEKVAPVPGIADGRAVE